jgi:hypothetical protein
MLWYFKNAILLYTTTHLKKGEFLMRNFLANVPEQAVGMIYMLSGLLILLDTLSIIHASVLIIIIALLAIAHGFYMAQGPRIVSKLLENVHINKKR